MAQCHSFICCRRFVHCVASGDGTTWQKSKPVLEKNSVLPLVVGQFETSPGDELGDLKRVDELEKKSKDIKAPLEDRWGILTLNSRARPADHHS
jgi:hypothetical protein